MSSYISRVQGAGYDGFSKSNNAREAESQGRYPLSKASQVLAKKLNWSIAKAKAFLLQMGTTEWHHTSKKYNITNYYDVSDEAIKDLEEEISSFVFDAKKDGKKEQKTWFKCWNMDRDEPRKWDWKITNRDGSNCYTFFVVKEKLGSLLETWSEKLKNEKHATKLRIARENVEAIKNILKVLI